MVVEDGVVLDVFEDFVGDILGLLYGENGLFTALDEFGDEVVCVEVADVVDFVHEECREAILLVVLVVYVPDLEDAGLSVLGQLGPVGLELGEFPLD